MADGNCSLLKAGVEIFRTLKLKKVKKRSSNQISILFVKQYSHILQMTLFLCLTNNATLLPHFLKLVLKMDINS